jgi:sigma-B regulation protein RsbU (phosphoserine phosphatase)
MPFDTDHLRLTDFMDLPTLQEIQDSFAAVANVRATITDADGNVLTQPQPTSEFLRRQRVIAQTEETVDGAADAQTDGPQRAGREYVAPIVVNNQRLGTLRMSPNGTPAGIDEARLNSLSEKFGLDGKQMRSLVGSLMRSRTARPAAIQFLYLLANAITRLCFKEFELRQRIAELEAVYNVTMTLAEARDLGTVLNRAVKIVAELMDAKAASIRLLDGESDELKIAAVHNLSREYLNKGMILLSRAEIDREALSPKGYSYSEDIATDPRTLYPEDAKREGIASVLSAGLRFQGRPVGVLRVYTEAPRTFSQLQINLLKAVAAQAGAAIENTRLHVEAVEAQRLEEQVRMAADVQQRMIPHTPPNLPGFEVATVYEPCFELGGDLYDFFPLPYDNLGLVIADVSGKGLPASLIMATVRASLRAQVDNLYYIDEVVRRINTMLFRETTTSEFVTLLYGVVDAPNRRLTYCNAGHPPVMLLRDGVVSELATGNMVLGVSPDEPYTQSILELESGDTLLLYTDGLSDAMNFEKQTFGRQRVIEALTKGGETAEAVAQNILWEMRRFIGLSKRTDDVTMIVVRVK